MRRIPAKRHKLGSYEINKKSSLCFDDKRFVSKDGIHTRAYFHKDFKKNKKSFHKKDSKRFSWKEKVQKDSHRKKTFKKILIKRRDLRRFSWKEKI